MEFSEVLSRRHCVRAYLDKPVEPVKLKRILEAARGAPSAGNFQAYEIFVVRDGAKKGALVDASHGQRFIAEAPIVLVFCASPERSKYYGERGERLYSIQDATIAASFAWLATVAEGLGSVWVGAFDDDKVTSVIGVDGLRPCVILPIGYPVVRPKPTKRRAFNKLVHEV